MRRLGPYLLLTCLAVAVLGGNGQTAAAPVHMGSAQALSQNDQDRQTAKYNRKLERLEIKRARDRAKLDAEYLKLFQRKKSIDLRKLQEELDEFQRKRDKVEEKYRRELEKMERERARSG